MKIELIGYNLDNLVKVLHRKKIPLSNIERLSYKKLSFEINDKDYRKVKKHVANFKVKETLSIIKRLPLILLNNYGYILGVFFAVLFYVFASNFTWQIEVYGIKDLSKCEILSVLKDNGIQKGKINNQTCKDIENILINKYDRIAQVSVIKEGTAIIINLSEKLVYNEIQYSPILAKYAGVIKEINVITGTINVKVGDYVNAGDVLVLPFNVNSNGEKVSVNPLAEIKAEIYVVEKLEINQVETKLIRTGRSITIYNYRLKNKKIFSSKKKNSFALFETVMYNENITDVLPMNRDVIVYYELSEVKITNDLWREKESLEMKSKDLAYENLPVGKILNEKTETSIFIDKMIAVTTIAVYGIIS